jgi:hypothetical protein
LAKFISECGDTSLVGFLSDSVGAMLGAGLPTLLMQMQVSLVGVLGAGTMGVAASS